MAEVYLHSDETQHRSYISHRTSRGIDKERAVRDSEAFFDHAATSIGGPFGVLEVFLSELVHSSFTKGSVRLFYKLCPCSIVTKLRIQCVSDGMSAVATTQTSECIAYHFRVVI